MSRDTYIGKRFSDVIFSIILLIITSPFFIFISLVIYLSNGRPIFYKGIRVGINENLFYQYKFRTMYENNSKVSFTTHDDTRITKVGKFLRLLKLDELPQLFNVLKGDMSIVGPRPEAKNVVDKYYSDIEKEVFKVLPGITSPLVLKYYPDYNYHIDNKNSNQDYYNNFLLQERLIEDLNYVKNMSFFYDLKIISKTFFSIIFKTWFYLKKSNNKAFR